MTERIYITQADNQYYFGNKLPTFRDGFCYIQRKVTPSVDQHGIYTEPGEYGTIKANGKLLYVCGDKDNKEICGVV